MPHLKDFQILDSIARTESPVTLRRVLETNRRLHGSPGGKARVARVIGAWQKTTTAGSPIDSMNTANAGAFRMRNAEGERGAERAGKDTEALTFSHPHRHQEAASPSGGLEAQVEHLTATCSRLMEENRRLRAAQVRLRIARGGGVADSAASPASTEAIPIDLEAAPQVEQLMVQVKALIEQNEQLVKRAVLSEERERAQQNRDAVEIDSLRQFKREHSFAGSKGVSPDLYLEVHRQLKRALDEVAVLKQGLQAKGVDPALYLEST